MTEQIEYKTDFPANRVTWRGVTYDSQLEADWAATLTAWGMLFVYHPGRVYLTDSVWEPDFQVDGDIVLEVKGPGNARIEKAWEASSMGLNVIIARQGFMPPVNELEVAGAVWEPSEYVVVNDDGRLVFVRSTEAGAGAGAMHTADYAYAHGKMGIKMFKAVGEDGIV